MYDNFPFNSRLISCMNVRYSMVHFDWLSINVDSVGLRSLIRVISLSMKVKLSIIFYIYSVFTRAIMEVRYST